MKRKAVILDRDGVINMERGEYTFREEDFEFTPGLGEALAELKSKGYIFIVISNQSGISKRIYTSSDVMKLHEKTKSYLAAFGVEIEALFFCPHHPDFNGKCLCRKPASILYEKAVARFDIDISRSVVIGDKERDILPAQKLGFTTFKVESNTPLKKIVPLIA